MTADLRWSRFSPASASWVEELSEGARMNALAWWQIVMEGTPSLAAAGALAFGRAIGGAGDGPQEEEQSGIRIDPDDPGAALEQASGRKRLRPRPKGTPDTDPRIGREWF